MKSKGDSNGGGDDDDDKKKKILLQTDTKKIVARSSVFSTEFVAEQAVAAVELGVQMKESDMLLVTQSPKATDFIKSAALNNVGRSSQGGKGYASATSYPSSIPRCLFREEDGLPINPTWAAHCHGTSIKMYIVKDAIVVGGDGRTVNTLTKEILTDMSIKVHKIGKNLVCAQAGDEGLNYKFVTYLKTQVSNFESRGEIRPRTETCAKMFPKFFEKSYDITKKGKITWNKAQRRSLDSCFILVGFDDDQNGEPEAHAWVSSKLGVWREFKSYSLGSGSEYSDQFVCDDDSTSSEAEEKMRQSLFNSAFNDFCTGGYFTIATVKPGGVTLQEISVQELMKVYNRVFDESSEKTSV